MDPVQVKVTAPVTQRDGQVDEHLLEVLDTGGVGAILSGHLAEVNGCGENRVVRPQGLSRGVE